MYGIKIRCDIWQNMSFWSDCQECAELSRYLYIYRERDTDRYRYIQRSPVGTHYISGQGWMDESLHVCMCLSVSTSSSLLLYVHGSEMAY